MKNFKLLFLSFALIAGLFTSCSDNDSVAEDQNIQETQAITTSLERLAGQFNDQGEVMASANPAGNIVFDFGFDFVYPLNLSLSNGTTVAVNSLEDLIQILINSTDDLFVNGIEFPFDVEIYDPTTDSIIVVTINNENEFLDLLDSLDWDDDDLCTCTEEYDPVCVEVTDPAGTSFVISYPNACYALCDGFDETDFVDNCEDDYNNSGGYFECFQFNFPLTVITDDGETITVNSQEELDSALYNAYYFDFVYPFEVTDEDGEIVVITDVIDLIDLLEDCYDYYEGNDPSDDCDCDLEVFDPVCVELVTTTGEVEIIVFPNSCIAECEGFNAEDYIDCENTNDPVDCTEEDYTENLLGCQHFVFPLDPSGGQDEAYFFDFEADGTLTIESLNSNYTTTGTWDIVDGQETPFGDQLLIINEALGDFNDEWGITGCDSQFVYMYSVDQNYVIDVVCE